MLLRLGNGAGMPGNVASRRMVFLLTTPENYLIPTRGLADSIGASQELASQNRWWRRGDSPCDRGLHFARTMTPLACAGVARRTKSAAQGRRLLALAEIYDGGSRTKAACVGGVGLQTIRDWVLRFNAHGPEGLADRQAPGHPGKLNTAQREALAAMVESGPMPAIHGVVRWRLKDLAMWVWEEFRVSVSETTLSRILRALGYRKLSARPRHHAQAAGAVDAFKKRSPSAWTRSRATRGSIATG